MPIRNKKPKCATANKACGMSCKPKAAICADQRKKLAANSKKAGLKGQAARDYVQSRIDRYKKLVDGAGAGKSPEKVTKKKATPTQKDQKPKTVLEAKAVKVANPKVPAKKATSISERNKITREKDRIARVAAAEERDKNSITTRTDDSKKPTITTDSSEVKALKKELGVADATAKIYTANATQTARLEDFKDWGAYDDASDRLLRTGNQLKDNSLDVNNRVVLPNSLGLKDSDKISKLIQALPDGTLVILPEGAEELAKKLGVSSKKIGNNGSVQVTGATGVVEKGKLRERTQAELKEIAQIRKIREEIPKNLMQLHFDEMGISRYAPNVDELFKPEPLKPTQVAAILAAEDKQHEELNAIEDRHLGRKPTGKHGDYASYEKKSADWAKAKFGEFNEGANGFTLAQTKAHDIAHPVTHDLIGLDSDGIHKKLGNLTDAKGNNALYAEEAIVNVMEQLSRGSSIEASILNGVRLARNMTRPDPVTGIQSASKEANSYVRSPKFVQDLSDLAHKAYRHNDFAPLIGHVRKSNRISGTVTAAGDDFNNSATGG